jgi:hypothetical protein
LPSTRTSPKLPRATFGNSSSKCPRSTSMATSSIGPLYLCKESTEFFLVYARGCLMHKISASTKKWHSPRRLVPHLLSKKNHRGSFLRKKLKYTDSLYHIRINTSSFSFFNVKIWISFSKKIQKRKKLVEFTIEKKIQNLLNFFVKTWRNFARKKRYW